VGESPWGFKSLRPHRQELPAYVPFKEVTSALRRLAPLGLSTDIIWSANVRTLRHVIEMRTAEGAEEELRSVFDQVARVMLREAPFTSRTSSATPTAVGGALHKV
jgi:thymidylate synthase ThyX